MTELTCYLECGHKFVWGETPDTPGASLPKIGNVVYCDECETDQEIEMNGIRVRYEGGESRYYPGEAVDYMLVEVDGVELYAEAVPGNDETDTYDTLRLDILAQARANAIDPACLRFHYDE